MPPKSNTNHHLRARLRSQLRAEREALPPEELLKRSSAICKRTQLLLGDARLIAGYFALGAEVDLSAFARGLSVKECQYYVPVVFGQHQMMFAPVDESTTMQCNQFGIKEPVIDRNLLVSGMQLDIVLVPLVGFDLQCNRMGMGGGYYDRCFEQRKTISPPPTLIGVAYECQCVDSVLAETWDVKLDHIVTEKRILSAE